MSSSLLLTVFHLQGWDALGITFIVTRISSELSGKMKQLSVLGSFMNTATGGVWIWRRPSNPESCLFSNTHMVVFTGHFITVNETRVFFTSVIFGLTRCHVAEELSDSWTNVSADLILPHSIYICLVLFVSFFGNAVCSVVVDRKR